MHAPAPRHTVALCVVPKLLSDVLQRALSDVGVRVLASNALPGGTGMADVAVLSASAPDIPAKVVIRLPAEADAGVGSVTAGDRRERIVLDSPAAVIAAVRSHC